MGASTLTKFQDRYDLIGADNASHVRSEKAEWGAAYHARDSEADRLPLGGGSAAATGAAACLPENSRPAIVIISGSGIAGVGWHEEVDRIRTGFRQLMLIANGCIYSEASSTAGTWVKSIAP